MTIFPDDETPDENDDEQAVFDQAMRSQADVLLERKTDFLEDLTKLGLYLEDEQLIAVPGPLGDPTMTMALSCRIGDVAFTQRVQNPEAEKVDDQFREIAVDSARDAWLDARREIEEARKRGEHPLGLEDEP